MEEGSVTLGSWNLSLTNSGILDNFPATQYAITISFSLLWSHLLKVNHIAEASVVEKNLIFTWIIPT
jgi:hypothetical protein